MAADDKNERGAGCARTDQVGKVFIVVGQSNAANHGSVKTQTKTGLVSSFDGTTWHLANDPQLGATGDGGSFMPAFGDSIATKFKVPVGLVPRAVGGTSVREWLPKGEKVDHLTTTGAGLTAVGPGQWESNGILFARLSDALTGLGAHGCRAVLWHQGESDAGQARSGYPAAVQISGDEYASYMGVLINASRKVAGWDVPWFTAQATYHSEADPADPEFRAAQKSLWDSKLALEGPDTDVLRAEYRNGVHMNDKGLQKHGELWAEKVGVWLETQLELK